MPLIQSILGALGAKYEESKPVLDSELLEFATPKQAEMLAKYDALAKEGNKMAGAFALALRIKLANAMSAEAAPAEPKVVRAKRAKR